MATMTAPQFIGGSSQLTSGSVIKSNFSQIGLRSRSMTHSGLRSLNTIDRLQMKSYAKAVVTKATKNGQQTPNNVPSKKIICQQGMNLVFVGAEVAPWSKTGGLGDVLGGLPPALAARGHRVMSVAPRYDQYKDAWDTSVLAEVKVGDSIETVRFFHCYKRGVDRVFVDHPVFLEKVWGKTGSKIYGPKAGLDYEDNQLRFSLLCQAALEAPRILNLNNNKYFSGPYGSNFIGLYFLLYTAAGEDVLFIGNDWHTALLSCYLKFMYQSKGIYKNAKVAFCIHNIAYQGRFPFADFSLLNLPDDFRGRLCRPRYDKPVKGRKINWMKAGILESDRVLTVSPHYAKELISGEEKGVELDNIIRKTGISGIVNGMDVQEWNPSTDRYINVNYDATTVMNAKPLVKEALQSQLGLPVDRNIPLIGFIGRLEEQKGSDILAQAIPKFMGGNVQIVVLGTGKKPMEQQIEQLEIICPEKARGITKFSIPLAHKIIAGADFMLVPSRFEPCGLIQLHAMRYGTVPIVASTGGLFNTVKEGITGFQMGSFHVECDRVDLADVAAIAKHVNRAVATYGTPALKEMIQNCMALDLSWKEPASLWEKMLLSMEVAGSEPGIEGDEIAPLARENLATP
ncbi:hypothetical protein CUMW_177330 [Citrus unshiu]|uniref:Granule-bound starch synthase 1, chloroplastic/amyloplastic n=1 Tax=Citrus unshiu TaxID=55188 RepID=A0A2H5PXR3_CITUN|nr:hypothetical protein CUMW_177330 [Citrus unshiu]